MLSRLCPETRLKKMSVERRLSAEVENRVFRDRQDQESVIFPAYLHFIEALKQLLGDEQPLFLHPGRHKASHVFYQIAPEYWAKSRGGRSMVSEASRTSASTASSLLSESISRDLTISETMTSTNFSALRDSFFPREKDHRSRPDLQHSKILDRLRRSWFA